MAAPHTFRRGCCHENPSLTSCADVRPPSGRTRTAGRSPPRVRPDRPAARAS
ncbi:hypothetical protein SFR_3488 [Streptomyces sp. FR-008]|nr:hypothetical protein SFR_3488 [Streptomyces sp. FR-008]